MTARYDRELDAFARGRSFIRLTPAVVNRRGITCDACGSDRPRVLHALLDGADAGLSLVGQSCLEALTLRRVVGRRPRRARTEHAYEEEIGRREVPSAPVPNARTPDAAAHSSIEPARAAEPSAGAMLLVAIVQPARWGALLDLLGADQDACLIVPLGAQPPSLAGAAVPIDRIHEFAARAAAAGGRLAE